MTEVETVVQDVAVVEVVSVEPIESVATVLTAKAQREALRVATKARIEAAKAEYTAQKARNEKTAVADLAYAADRDSRAAAAELAWLNG